MYKALKFSLFMCIVVLCFLNADRASGETSALEIDLVGTCLWTKLLTIAVDGPYAYCGLPYGIVVLDITDPANPAYVSRVYLPGAYQLDISGDYLYVGCGHSQAEATLGGWHIIDISDPAQPEVVFSYDTPYRVWRVSVFDDFVYVCSELEGVLIFDVKTPTSPVFTGLYESDRHPAHVAVSGDYLYLADVYGMEVLDISNPSNPVLIGSLSMPECEELVVRGDYLYACDRYDGLTIFTLADPANPVQVGLFNFPYTPLLDVSFTDSIACLTFRDTLLATVSVADPNNPYLLGVYDSSMPYPTWSTLAVEGNLAYVADSNAVRIVDISDPTAPEIVRNYYINGPPWQVEAAGGYAYLADRSGLEVVDISGDGDPPEVGHHWTIDKAFDVDVEGDLAVLAGAFRGVHIFDVSDPTNPIELSVYDSPGYARGVKLEGNLIFVSDDDSVIIVDITDPTSPTRLGALDTPDHVYNVRISDTLAFIGDYKAGIHIANIADPANPYIINSFMFGAGWTRLAELHEDYACVLSTWVNYYNDLQIVEVSNPMAPQLRSYVTFPSAPTDVKIVDNLAFVSTFWRGVFVVDLTDPDFPHIVGEYNTPGICYGVDVEGDRIYLADTFGMMVLSYRTPPVLCGDADDDGSLSVSDAVYLINYIFKGGPAPYPLCAADASDDDDVNVGDAVYLIEYVFKGGPPPPDNCCP